MNGVRKWLSGFRYAYEGLKYALSTQRNMKFHFFVAFAVLIVALILHVTTMEILFIMLSITLVVVTELINTAIEKTVDLAMPNQHPIAKIAKDVAAASVLVTAVFAVAVALVIFYQPIDQLFHTMRTSQGPLRVETIWIFITLVALVVIMIETRFANQGKPLRLSLISAVAFAVSTLMALLVTATPVILLSYSLSALIVIILYDKTDRTLQSLFISGLLGSFITLLAHYVIHTI